MTNSLNYIEPIITNRRGLLKATNIPQLSNEYCHLLLESSRLARHSGHLQTAWTFLVEAKALGIYNINIAMEEARYLFQKVI